MWSLRSIGGIFWRSVELRITDSNTVSYECVRWHRKPRWVPIAKSKLFKIPDRKRLPPDEREEFRRLHNNYRAHMRSIQ